MAGYLLTFAATGAIGLNMWLIFSLIRDIQDLRLKVFKLEGGQDIIEEVGASLRAIRNEQETRATKIARIERELMGERLQ